MVCQIETPPSDVFVTTGNRGHYFPNLDCPIEESTIICPLIVQEGQENVLLLETGDFLIIPCQP